MSFSFSHVLQSLQRKINRTELFIQRHTLLTIISNKNSIIHKHWVNQQQLARFSFSLFPPYIFKIYIKIKKLINRSIISTIVENDEIWFAVVICHKMPIYIYYYLLMSLGFNIFCYCRFEINDDWYLIWLRLS